MFLGYEFSTYGLDVVNFSEKHPMDRQDPMHTVFPNVTKYIHFFISVFFFFLSFSLFRYLSFF